MKIKLEAYPHTISQAGKVKEAWTNKNLLEKIINVALEALATVIMAIGETIVLPGRFLINWIGHKNDTPQVAATKETPAMPPEEIETALREGLLMQR